MEVDKILKSVDLFTGLTRTNLSRIAKACKPRSYSADDVIVKQDTEGLGLFIITSGKVKIRKTQENGTVMDIATHGSGEFFGEMAVLDGAKRTADVIAVEATECLVLVSWDFNAIMKSHPEIALDVLPVVVRRFRETNEKLLNK